MTLICICSLSVLVVSPTDRYFNFQAFALLDNDISTKINQSHFYSEDKFLSFILDVALVFVLKNHADSAFELDPYALGVQVLPGPVPLLNLVEDAQLI